MHPRLPALLVLLSTAPLPALAQAPGAEDSLLSRLTLEALASAPALRQSEARTRAAGARIRPAGALPDPMLSVGVMDLTLPRFAFRESDFTEVDVELSQAFPWPGTLRAETRAARAMARQAGAEALGLRREIVLQVAVLYYRLRYVVAAQQTLVRQRGLLQSAVEISLARYATGSVPQSDPLQARIALIRLDAEEATLEAQEAGLRADLRALRGPGRAEVLTIAPIETDSVAALLAEAASIHEAHLRRPDPLGSHPRLQALRAGVEAARESATAQALAARPDFEISTRYGARPLGADFFSAFVGIRLPLWAGRKQGRLAEAARLETEAAERGLEERHAALLSELERTLADARAGATQLRLLVGSVLPVTEEAVSASLRDYRTGQADFQAVLTAEDARYRAELEAAEIAAMHLTHLIMLDQLLAPEATP